MIDKQNKIIKPFILNPGDEIGVVAPASPFDFKKFNQGVSVLENLGYKVVILPGLFKTSGYLAGSDQHRADIIHKMFAASNIKAVFCARGGFGSLRILPLLDFDLIKKNPKIFLGFSDITALLSVLKEKCSMVVFHGPNITTLGNSGEQFAKTLLNAMTENKPVEIQEPGAIILKPGIAFGRVIGGNLSTICHLLGTPFAPAFKNSILLLEDRGEALYRIDRMLTQLKLAGCFKELAGLILGDFAQCNDKQLIYQLVKSVFKEIELPILAGLPIGHIQQNITIPLGIEAMLDTERKGIFFQEAAICSEIIQTEIK